MVQRKSTTHYLAVLFFVLTVFYSCTDANKHKSEEDQIVKIVFGTITDIDGNEYKTIFVGEMEWMAENLRVAHYSDGTAIPHKQSANEWKTIGNDRIGAFSVYPKACSDEDIIDDSLSTKYGKLYNWYSIENNQPLCPTGWRVPEEDDWVNLIRHVEREIRHVERENSAGVVLKSDQGWDNDGNGLNLIGFNVLPSGYRDVYGDFHNKGSYSAFWSMTPSGTETAKGIRLDSDRTYIGRGTGNRSQGFAVRCIRIKE